MQISDSLDGAKRLAPITEQEYEQIIEFIDAFDEGSDLPELGLATLEKFRVVIEKYQRQRQYQNTIEDSH